MKMHRLKLAEVILLAGAMLAGAASAWAEPTNVTVRVISRDAKFIGSSIGGVQVLIRDADTGEILAQGKTAGSTGDTNLIMTQPRSRGTPISTGGAARFTATLDLDAPRLIEVEAFGPAAQRQSANRVSATQWVVPGKHLTGGDGWLLEMPGFLVDVLEPPAHRTVKGAPQAIELRANVTMMCGCPIEPGGLWGAGRYEVTALVTRNGEPAGQVPLSYAGAASQFSGSLQADGPGVYEAVVYAYDPQTGNTGLDRVTFIVAAP
jgi:hypothetical protein